jgi:signal transduction histidine kinase/DNA-binding response OmpR family regulator
MTPNEVFALIVEGVFAIVFVGALVDFVRRRNPVSRDVALAFSPFVGLLLITVWRWALGPAPTPIALIFGLLFLAQPLIALHLVALIRPVPKAVQLSAVLALAASLVPVLVIRPAPAVLSFLTLGVFTGIQLVTASYLVLEARARRGPGGRRLAIAAASTVGLAIALLLMSGSALGGSEAGPVILTGALALALLSGIGYVVAFMPPAPIRRVWQAGATVRYQHDLLMRAGEPVETIWAGFADLAAETTAAPCAVLEDAADGTARVLASARLQGATLPERFASGGATVSQEPQDVPVAGLPADDPIRQLAEAVGARFVSVVDLTETGRRHRFLVVAGSHRTLFHESDLGLLSALGIQTGLLAERRAMLAEQEALTAQLANTVEALRAAARAKSDFLASMSHELRTPLSAILGFSDLMRQEPRDGESLTVPAEWVEHVHRGGEHLLALVNDVLDLSKVEAGRMELHLERIDLASAVTELVNGVRPLADRKDLALEADVPAMAVVADRGRLRQILYNLVSNAIKFTPAGGTVRIAATTTAEGYRLSVSDTGVGIAPEDLPQIFEEFRQVGDEDAREGGTGLGLALAQRLVGAHDGTIDVTSTVGQGTTFMVAMPRLGLEAPAPSTSPSPRSTTSGAPMDERDILVIEDDPSAIRLLREYLEPAGYTLRAAADGEQGLAMAREHRPIAVLLDVLVPRIDGWEVLRRLKADEVLKDVPVVMVTVVDEREVGLALGAVDYLVKPVQRKALLACLARIGLDAVAASGRPAIILTVDDEPAALDLIDGYLAGSGIDVVRAEDGRAAIEIARSRDVDLVICDLIMPGLDGFDVVAELKADTSTASIPILICTAHDLTAEQKTRLHGQILGIVAKGPSARDGLRGWLSRVRLEPGVLGV